MAPVKRPPVKPRPTQRKLTGGLKARAEVRKYETVLLGDIQAHAVSKAAADDTRRTDCLHPSEMAKSDWCPRASYYRISGVQPEDEEVLFYGITSIFEEGNVAHTKWQNWLGEMGRLYGRWGCVVCGWAVMGTSIVHCADCGRPGTMKYLEVPMDAEERYLIHGHADGAVLDISALIEIKTIGLGTVRMEQPDLVRQHTQKTERGKSIVDVEGLWSSIKRPFPSHRRQAQIYLRIANLMGLKLERAIFIYEYKANQATKEFTIVYDPSLTDDLFEIARDVKFAVAEGNVIDRPVGYAPDLKPCTKCPFKITCWGEEANDGASQQERDPGDGQAQPRGKASAGAAPDRDADPAGQRIPRTSGRSHRAVRRQADETVRSGDQVERVPERPSSRSRNRRAILRGAAGEDQGSAEPGAPEREDRPRRKGARVE
jgi:CRISPR/Cas system-associated exonuclease Cas4 (RecB family)